MTVGEAAAHWPGTARVFEAHGIDFCCVGQISIAEACLARGLDPADVLEELEQAKRTQAGTDDWEHAPTGELIDHIVERHHAYLKSQLPRIHAQMEEVVNKYAHDHGELLRALWACFRAMQEELEARLLHQETVLFPALRELESRTPVTHSPHHGGERDPVQVMLEGHDFTARALSEMRRITSNYQLPEGAGPDHEALYRALRELEADLHRHFHLEHNILFHRMAGLTQHVATAR